jgi:hypothetical protein
VKRRFPSKTIWDGSKLARWLGAAPETHTGPESDAAGDGGQKKRGKDDVDLGSKWSLRACQGVTTVMTAETLNDLQRERSNKCDQQITWSFARIEILPRDW